MSGSLDFSTLTHQLLRILLFISELQDFFFFLSDLHVVIFCWI